MVVVGRERTTIANQQTSTLNLNMSRVFGVSMDLNLHSALGPLYCPGDVNDDPTSPALSQLASLSPQ